jgi:hypothetical protein
LGYLRYCSQRLVSNELQHEMLLGCQRAAF